MRWMSASDVLDLCGATFCSRAVRWLWLATLSLASLGDRLSQICCWLYPDCSASVDSYVESCDLYKSPREGIPVWLASFLSQPWFIAWDASSGIAIHAVTGNDSTKGTGLPLERETPRNSNQSWSTARHQTSLDPSSFNESHDMLK